MLLSSHTQSLLEAGCDEAGRGCLAGPVVAASVILPKDYSHPMLNDSKKISKPIREKLREEIMRDAIAWGIAEVSHQEIDEMNILKASILAMHRAVEKLSVKPELLLIDGNRFYAYKNIPHQCVIKGDGIYLSIAAASILAKTYRDALMTQFSKQYPGYGWHTNMGYPTLFHREGIVKWGISPLHRKTFNLLPNQLPLFPSKKIKA